jgi:pyridoxamine 5'-phosphate oxidase
VSVADPLTQVLDWYELARAEGVAEPEAAALATATPEGRPSVRMVLVRGIDDRGVAF